ncbi:MAG: tspO/MBR family protein [Rubritepida sp.]|nr:tspO/MBR family protein [Rubritepida sp.]
MNDLVGLAGFLCACFAAALAGLLFPVGAWYDELRKPSWNPPKWIFGPAWTVLYIMMGVAAWLVWRETGFGTAIAVFGLQLVLNLLWTALFFGMKRPDLALYELVLLWLTILACILLFAPVSGWAALLLLPYLAWTGFAGFLNLSILRLNGAQAGS